MRHRKRSNIIIELTPLLDVIMILIFIIMTNNSEKVIEAQEATDRAKTNAEKAAKEYEARISEQDLEYSSALEALNSELENVRVSAEETVFIDDSVRNLEGAAELGIYPILIAANPEADVDISCLKIHDLRELL